MSLPPHHRQLLMEIPSIMYAVWLVQICWRVVIRQCVGYSCASADTVWYQSKSSLSWNGWWRGDAGGVTPGEIAFVIIFVYIYSHSHYNTHLQLHLKIFMHTIVIESIIIEFHHRIIYSTGISCLFCHRCCNDEVPFQCQWNGHNPKHRIWMALPFLIKVCIWRNNNYVAWSWMTFIIAHSVCCPFGQDGCTCVLIQSNSWIDKGYGQWNTKI